ncbi:hypothetical protein AALP_AAs67063U000100 [Arabis alpina]|uniref:Uncharacterized protein n=1 Tax=Arabis alpina TaxID=50452 RepID=A0A087G3M1_ARAAL|nr:hypothetical protein AALP_AAs67063U000100 [Arabis alpina]
MSSDSSASVKLDRKRVRLDPNVTLARASDHAFDASVPTSVPLVGRSDRHPLDVSSPEIELPTFRPEVTPLMETGPFSPRPALGDSTEGESSYANPESSSREPKSPGPGLGHGIRLDDTKDIASTMTVRLVNALKPAGGWEGSSILHPQANDRPWSPPPGYMCVFECFIKNGGLCFPVPRLLLQYCNRRQIALSQLTHGSMRTMMAVVVLAAEYGGVVNLDEVEEISSFSSMGNTGRFYVSPRGGYQLVAGHCSQMLAGYNFLSYARYDLDQKNRKLNTQNGELVAESSRSKEARTRAESEVVKFKDLLSHSQQMNGELIASRDKLSSKFAALTSALAKAEEAKKDEVSRIDGEVADIRSSSKDAVARAVEEVRRKAKDKLRRSIEIMEGRSKAQTEVDCLASLVSQVTGAIRRMKKAVKDGVPIDAAKKEKLEAHLAAYIAEADSIVFPSLPTDSSDGEETEPKKSVALDSSSSDSSDDEAERIEADG